MDVENIGKFLLKLRKENNLTQKDIAKLCNISTQAVSKWERGVSVPDIEILERLSILYKLSINEIISGEKKEVYLDIEKRKNIIGLTASVLVFVAYLFNFVHGDVSFGYYRYYDFELIMKGYQLIFNGTSGIIVYLSWLVFSVLVSHLIIRIYLITKVLNETQNIRNYLKISLIVVIVISFISVIIPVYYIFPQFIIILAMVVQLSLIENLKKHKDKDEVLYDKKLIKLPEIAILVGIIYHVIFFLLGTVMTIIEFFNEYRDSELLLTNLFALVIIGGLIAGMYVLYRKFLLNHSKKTLLYLVLINFAFPLFLLVGMRFDFPEGMLLVLFLSIYLVTLGIPLFLFYTAFTMESKQKDLLN